MQIKIHYSLTILFALFSLLFFVSIFFDDSTMIGHIGFMISSLITFLFIKFTPKN